MTASKEKVRVYSTQTCQYCYMVKDFLTDHKIKFEDVDVGKDHGAAQDMVKKSGQMGVPVVEIGNKIIVGFDRDAIKNALKLK
ncbi:MAG: NrdH-redoxin [Nanoarchaeota archaeon]|nr:NrdH-redoxin [Nanoarchaeota archaeon]